MLQKLLLILFVCFYSSFALAKLTYHPLQFPRDEAAHFANVPYTTKNLTEWWFYNGKLTATNGREFGYYLSYFYMQTHEKGKKVSTPQFVMQIVDLKNQKTYAYGLFYPEDEAHFDTNKLNVSLGKDVHMQKINNTYLMDGAVQSRQGPIIQFSLQLTPTREALLAGGKGLVDTWGDQNSYNYSYTRLNTSGSLQIGKQKFQLNPQKSLSWMDHQWGDFIIYPGEMQWMWASVQLENGLELNLNMPIDPETKKPYDQKMNIVLPDGKTLHTAEFKFIPHLIKGSKYPLKYDLVVPELKLKLALNALSPKQDANQVWEGISRAEGTYKGAPVKGQAFTENTIFYQ